MITAVKQISPESYTATIDGTEWHGITAASHFWPQVQEYIAADGLVIPPPPSPYHDWDGGDWVGNVARAREAKLSELQSRRLAEIERATNTLGTSPSLLEAYRRDYEAALMVIAGRGAENVYDSITAAAYLTNRAAIKGATVDQFAAAVKWNYENAAVSARLINDTWTQKEKDTLAAATVESVQAIAWG